MLFVDSYSVAVDLLDKRSGAYSSRPRFTVTNDLYVLRYKFIVELYAQHFAEWGSIGSFLSCLTDRASANSAPFCIATCNRLCSTVTHSCRQMKRVEC